MPLKNADTRKSLFVRIVRIQYVFISIRNKILTAWNKHTNTRRSKNCKWCKTGCHFWPAWLNRVHSILITGSHVLLYDSVDIVFQYHYHYGIIRYRIYSIWERWNLIIRMKTRTLNIDMPHPIRHTPNTATLHPKLSYATTQTQLRHTPNLTTPQPKLSYATTQT